ncbi:MAG: alpha/beta hydrolase fold domain-containing protein [Acidimicrobiales bacterium]|nr:alpha/beta hydrolase fold domain-containing protein [Acidimicrobiales bacterium]
MVDETAPASALDADVVVVGAGFAGLYMLYRLRADGFSAIGIEAADDIGGTWYWNRYPGARCDIQSIDYSYSFDPELDQEWEWSEKYATQPEILRYIHHVADKHDLTRDIRFETKVTSAVWDEASATWTIHTVPADGSGAGSGDGETLTCRHYVMATGCLSMPKAPDIPGAERFTGPTYYTSSWPQEGVDFTGMRVGVIGTGSSGIQSIPHIAEQAEHLTVFQRTPNFSFPAGNGPIPEEKVEAFRADRDAYREEARWSGIGVPNDPPMESSDQLSDEEIERRFEETWRRGELVAIGSAYRDWLLNPEANERFAEFVRNKIRGIVDDPEVAETLCPDDYPIGTKRPCLDTDYFATFNRPNVSLVDLKKTPIEAITETGIATVGSEGGGEDFEFDAIVYATGFDAMTGAIVNVDITGRDGVTLADEWARGPETYLGLMSARFPNLYMITGPGSPSVLSNMMVSIEQHVDWIADALDHLRSEGLDVIEPTETAQSAWVRYGNDWADLTLYPRANSWYMGANVPGKPRVFLPFVGSVGRYRRICDEVVDRDYLGFELRGAGGRIVSNDGEIRRIRPDVEAYLDAIVDAGLPAFESLPPEQAREMNDMLAQQRPPGPDVGEIVDATFPGPAGELDYRLYRPATAGPHPVVVYFHGGGWVLGSSASDDPLCRYLCVHADAIVVSVDYRHAPESPFPAAVDDAFAGLQWVADHAEELGGVPGRLAVAGWSAGGNLAAVTALLARDAGGPELSGQVLITPVTDADTSRRSWSDNAEGFGLTASMMHWFWDCYIDAADGTNDRIDWRASPLRAPDLSGLPPAMVVTCELDPLRDEGDAYAAALADAGVDVDHLPCWGQSHLSIPGVDVIVTAEPIRSEVASELHRMLQVGAPAPA